MISDPNRERVLVFRDVAGALTPGSAWWLVHADTPTAHLGRTMLVHDFDGDHLDDLVLGAERDDTAGHAAGAVVLLYGDSW